MPLSNISLLILSLLKLFILCTGISFRVCVCIQKNMTLYEGPAWAAPPTESWTLVEIKGGVEVARHALNGRPYTLLGRDADQAHIVLSHDSCSRLHARIAFDGNGGTPWLRDLQSTHGTRVNKKPVPAASCGKTESMSTRPGSRGVILYPTDMIQFGASTRIFLLEGPDSFARRRQTVVLPPSTTMTTANKQPQYATAQPSLDLDHEKQPHKDDISEKNDNREVNWGIDFEDHSAGEEGATEGMKLPAHLSEQDIPERLRKEWNALRALQFKLEHTQQESERIRRKGALTDGQERQLGINQERIENLQHDIETKEAALYRKLYPEKVQREKEKEIAKSSYFDDDQVEDRTESSKQSVISTDQAESEESLTRKRQALMESWKQITSHVQTQSTKCKNLSDRIEYMKSQGEDETFFVQNDLDMASDVLKKEEKKLKNINQQIEEVDKLLKIINPKIVLKQATNEPDIPDEDGFAIPAPVSRAPPINDQDAFSMPPPMFSLPRVTKSDHAMPPPASKNEEPPVKRRRVQGATMPPPGFLSSSSNSTAASISSMLKPESKSPPLVSAQPQTDAKEKTAPVVADPEKYDKWQPPKVNIREYGCRSETLVAYLRLSTAFIGPRWERVYQIECKIWW